MNLDEGFEIGDLRGLVRRRAPMALGVGLAVFLVAIVVAAVLPNQYETHTTILVEPQTISQELVEAQMQGTDLNQRLHLMTMQILSRPRLSRVIDDLNLYREESQEMTREEIIAKMRGQIRVEPVLPELQEELDTRDLQINTFRLYFRHDDPQRAAAVANRLANDFIEEHIRERVEISSDTQEFIEAELARLAVQIQDVEQRIAEVKSENPGRLPEDMQANQQIYQRTLENLRDVQRQLSEARSDAAFYEQQSQVRSDVGAGSGRAMSPEQRLNMLELRLAEFKSRGFTPKHPDVMATREEIEAVQAQIASSAEEAEQEEQSLSAAQQTARAQARRAELRAEAARAEIERLQAQLDDVQQRMAETPRVAEQLSALERDYEHLFASFQSFSSKRLDAAVAANAERRQKGEKLRILESAVPPPDPTSPNRLLIAVMGVLLGGALGGGIGVLMEATDSSFHEGRKLQSTFRIPVLAQIPAIVLEADRVAQRRRRVLATVATGVLVAVVLAGAFAGYRMVNGGGGGGDAAGDRPAAQARQG